MELGTVVYPTMEETKSLSAQFSHLDLLGAFYNSFTVFMRIT